MNPDPCDKDHIITLLKEISRTESHTGTKRVGLWILKVIQFFFPDDFAIWDGGALLNPGCPTHFEATPAKRFSR
jgi:hypothetical protein